MILPDFKGRDGKWVSQVKEGEHKTHWTTAGVLWSNILKRCREGAKNEMSSYHGCSHSFIDFNDFAEWAIAQIGYGAQGFDLDKDILNKKNKIYCKEFCVFVPRVINGAFIRREGERGNFPIGVCWDKRSQSFLAQVRDGRKHKNLGHFQTAEDSHYAYKQAKEAHLKKLAEVYRNKIDERVYNVLLSYEVEEND